MCVGTGGEGIAQGFLIGVDEWFLFLLCVYRGRGPQFVVAMHVLDVCAFPLAAIPAIFVIKVQMWELGPIHNSMNETIFVLIFGSILWDVVFRHDWLRSFDDGSFNT